MHIPSSAGQITPIAATALITVALLASAASRADTGDVATTTLEVTAGLVPVMTLDCTDVSFGDYLVPTGSRGGATIVTLNSSGNASFSGGTEGVALASSGAQPSVGSCTVSGSQAADDTAGAVTFEISDDTLNADASNGPEAAVSDLTFTLAATNDSNMSNGALTFSVHGTLSIPNDLTESHYGQYRSESVTVSFDDSAGP
jgi:hypothetical protein